VEEEYKNWACVICGWVYEEEVGAPHHGLPVGMRWADVADEWRCPDCGASKADFEMVEF